MAINFQGSPKWVTKVLDNSNKKDILVFVSCLLHACKTQRVPRTVWETVSAPYLRLNEYLLYV
jgi:hypothetical protein